MKKDLILQINSILDEAPSLQSTVTTYLSLEKAKKLEELKVITLKKILKSLKKSSYFISKRNLKKLL